MDWSAEQRLAVVITDAPCHGKDYSEASHDIFCDPSTGLTCSGRPEEPLKALEAQKVSVFIFHTGEKHAVSMCEKLQESVPLIHQQVDPERTAERIGWALQSKLELKPLRYVLKPLDFSDSEAQEGPDTLDLAIAHDVEISGERHKIGASG